MLFQMKLLQDYINGEVDYSKVLNSDGSLRSTTAVARVNPAATPDDTCPRCMKKKPADDDWALASPFYCQCRSA